MKPLKRLLTVKELMEYTGRGRTQATQWGRDIGAAVQFGRHVVFDRLIIDREVDRLRDENARKTKPLEVVKGGEPHEDI